MMRPARPPKLRRSLRRRSRPRAAARRAGPAAPSGSRASRAARHRRDRSPWRPASRAPWRRGASVILRSSSSFCSRLNWMSTIAPISSRRRRWNRMISSTRFRNSGRKCARTTSMTSLVHGGRILALLLHDEEFRAEIRRHDDERVLEIDRAALAVGQAAVVEHLQQHVEHVRMRLLDLVEQHDLIGPAADGFGQRAAFLIADIAGRRADQAARPSASPCIPTCRAAPSPSRRRTGTPRAPWSARSCRRPWDQGT